MYPELREGAELTAAIEDTLREQPTRDATSFVRRRALKVTTTHVWQRDNLGVISCVETQEMSQVERSTSFRGSTEHIWTYLVNVEDYGFRPPTLVMVANILRRMCYPDQDLTMHGGTQRDDTDRTIYSGTPGIHGTDDAQYCKRRL